MISGTLKLRRVIAMRLRGEPGWRAGASDGQYIGRGFGGDWYAAVSEAIREVDEKHIEQKELSCGTESSSES